MMTFTAHDRCDRCAAQACCRAIKGCTDLIFCAHHGREYGPDLMAQGYRMEVTAEARSQVDLVRHR